MTTNDITKKLAAWAVVALAGLGAWQLKETYSMSDRLARMETKLEIWMTLSPLGALDEPDEAHLFYASMTGGAPAYEREQATDFARKAMIRACDQILKKDSYAALKTLLVGLEGLGVRCSPSGERVECK
jgi:hypothetical protein